MTPESLPSGVGLEPIETTKMATVYLTSAVPFEGVGFGARYGVSDDALCHAGRAPNSLATPHSEDPLFISELRHLAPDPDCNCGFWATMAPNEAQYPKHWRLHVELSGRVVEHEYGWRAEHQEVVLLEPPWECAACDQRAVYLALGANPWSSDQPVYAVCQSCWEKGTEYVLLIPEDVEEAVGVPVLVYPRTRIRTTEQRSTQVTVAVEGGGDGSSAPFYLPKDLGEVVRQTIGHGTWQAYHQPLIPGPHSLQLRTTATGDGIELLFHLDGVVIASRFVPFGKRG